MRTQTHGVLLAIERKTQLPKSPLARCSIRRQEMPPVLQLGVLNWDKVQARAKSVDTSVTITIIRIIVIVNRKFAFLLSCYNNMMFILRLRFVSCLGAFAKRGKVLASSCLSVRLHVTTLLPLDGFREILYLSFTVSPCIFYHKCLTCTNLCTCFKLY